MTDTSTTAMPDPNLLAAAFAAVAAEPLDDNAAALASLRATGEWLAERLEERVVELRAAAGNYEHEVSYRAGFITAIGDLRRLCGVPAPGAPEGSGSS